MKNITKNISAVLISTVLMMPSFYCLAEDAKDTAELIKEARVNIQQGEKQKAELALDAAFELANSSRDSEVLVEIGDLYLGIDKSLGEKAMKAWTAAGHWRCQ